VDAKSAYAPVKSGIPQGTILGPLLFIIFINDVTSVLKHSEVRLYADDSKWFSPVNNLLQYQHFSDDIYRMNEWFISWQLKINSGKCEVLHMGRTNTAFNYENDGHEIPKKEDCRDLGVIVNNKLNFHKHCLNVARIGHYRSKQFRRTFICHDHEFSVFLYTTYIRPLLEYCTEIWSPHHLQDIDAIEKVQKTFTKHLPGFYNISYPERLSRLNLKSLEERRVVKDIVFLYKIVHKLVNVDFDRFFSFNVNNTRGHNLKLDVKFSRLDCRKHFYCNRVVGYWNNLDSDIVNLQNVTSFITAVSSLDLSMYCRGRTL